jgi:plastocyanin
MLTFLGAAVVAVAAPGCTSKMKTAVVVPGPTINIVPGAFNKGMMAFSPDTITVHLNDTVRMHNGDSILHDIEPLSTGGPVWGSISGGSNSDVQATSLGTFHYVCAIGGHTMSGVLIVAP